MKLMLVHINVVVDVMVLVLVKQMSLLHVHLVVQLGNIVKLLVVLP